VITLDLNDIYQVGTIDELYGRRAPDAAITFVVFPFSHPAVEGLEKVAKFKDLLISHKNWQVRHPFKLRTLSTKPLLRCQFQLKGHTLYESTRVENKVSICIKESCCQFFYVPAIEGYFHYSQSRESFYIAIEPSFLFALLKEQNLASASLELAIANQTAFHLFEEARALSPRCLGIIQEIIQQSYRGDFGQTFLRCKSMELILLLFTEAKQQEQNLTRSIIGATDVAILYKVKQAIEANPAFDYVLLDIARQFGINDFKLKKGFKTLFHKTVFAYILEQRMVMASNLLKNSTEDIKEISHLVGYRYAHHFSKKFLNYYGVLPSTYRKKHLG